MRNTGAGVCVGAIQLLRWAKIMYMHTSVHKAWGTSVHVAAGGVDVNKGKNAACYSAHTRP